FGVGVAGAFVLDRQTGADPKVLDRRHYYRRAGERIERTGIHPDVRLQGYRVFGVLFQSVGPNAETLRQPRRHDERAHFDDAAVYAVRLAVYALYQGDRPRPGGVVRRGQRMRRLLATMAVAVRHGRQRRLDGSQSPVSLARGARAS